MVRKLWSSARISISRVIRFVGDVCVLCTFRTRKHLRPALPSVAVMQRPGEQNGMTEPTAERIADVSTVRPDPIGCDFSLPLKAVFHPLGFPVEIATNCAEVLAAAEENWKSFDNVFSAVPVQLHIAVSKGHA